MNKVNRNISDILDKRIINDGWYFFIDIVGSSDPNLLIFHQLEKIEQVRKIIINFLKEHGSPEIYKSFTGDGMLLVFLHYKYSLDLSINIHNELNQYNQNLSDCKKILVRIGIGAGSFLSFYDGVHKEQAPWGHELVLAKRIMDLARSNQILLTDFAFQKIRNDFLFNKNDYGYYLYDKGKIMLKHHDELESVYSFYKEKEFGNNSDIEHHLDLKPIILAHSIDRSYIEPLEDFCEKKLDLILKEFKDMTNPSKGLEMEPFTTDLLYRVLFENGEEYISATYLSPSEYWEIQNSEPLNLLNHHETLLNRMHGKNLVKNYRFLIIEKKRLDSDIKLNQQSSLLFIKWHSENNVNLYHAEINDLKEVLDKYPKLVYNVGIGLWYNKYVMQFGPIIEYINPKDQRHPLKKRRFWLHHFGSDTYTQCIKFFDELIEMAESKIMVKIDHNYYKTVIDEKA